MSAVGILHLETANLYLSYADIITYFFFYPTEGVFSPSPEITTPPQPWLNLQICLPTWQTFYLKELLKLALAWHIFWER